MKKIKVSICVGTACYVMGASELLLLEEQLPAHLRDCVEIEGVTCLELCKKSESNKAPFVMVGDEVIANANLLDILDKLEELVKKDA